MTSNRQIFVSTGGFQKFDPIYVVKLLNTHGLFNIELSGGTYFPNQEKQLKSLSKINNLLLHNYFPVPNEAFVLNLASDSFQIRNKTVQFIERAINISNMIGSEFYGFHSGFLLNLAVNDLGATIKRNICQSKSKGIDNFVDSVNNIVNKQNKSKVKLLVENNVLTKGNYKKFGSNPFLCCTGHEITEVFQKLPSNIGLLLDLAHLKITCETLNLNLDEEVDKVQNVVQFLHISENDGLSDLNQPINPDSELWVQANKFKCPVTLEIYSQNLAEINQQVTFAKQLL